MYFHISLIPRGAYLLLPLESKQEATWGWNFTKCISEVKVNQLKVKNMYVKMGTSTFKEIRRVKIHHQFTSFPKQLGQDSPTQKMGQVKIH